MHTRTAHLEHVVCWPITVLLDLFEASDQLVCARAYGKCVAIFFCSSEKLLVSCGYVKMIHAFDAVATLLLGVFQ